MKKRLFLLRFSYWFGAVFDGLMLIPMLIPKIGGSMFGLSDFNPGPEYRYAMGIGSALMAGWTVLLIWADRKPVERKGIIYVTVLPVIAGMIASSIYLMSSGIVAPGRVIPMLVTQSLTFAFFLFTGIYSRPLAVPKNLN